MHRTEDKINRYIAESQSAYILINIAKEILSEDEIRILRALPNSK